MGTQLVKKIASVAAGTMMKSASGSEQSRFGVGRQQRLIGGRWNGLREGDLHDGLPLDKVDSDGLGQDLGDAAGVHVSLSSGDQRFSPML